MDAYLAVISKREVRDYKPTPVSEDQIERMLQAGRATGSSRNRQPWQFVVVQNPERLAELATTVSAPDNIAGAPLAIAIVMRSAAQGFDAGRVTQNIMLAAWNDGIGTCPNSPLRDPERARELLEIDGDAHIATILSVGYPASPSEPEKSSPEAILRRINRKSLDELVRRL